MSASTMSTGTVVWTRQFGGSGYDAAYGIDVDATGVYVAGGTCSRLGSIPAERVGSLDAFVTKLGLDGNLVWTHQFGSDSFDDVAEAIAVHSSGVYVTGDAFIRKLDLDGRGMWTQRFGTATSSPRCAKDVAADATAIYVAGYVNGTCRLTYPTVGYLDARIEKYDANGATIWTRQFGTPANDSAVAVSVDLTGVYVAGSTDGTLPNQVNAGSFDPFVRRYGPDGEEGWTIQLGNTSDEFGLDIDDGGSGAYVSTSAFVARLAESVSAPPALAWIRPAGPAEGMAVDDEGGAYVVGGTTDPRIDIRNCISLATSERGGSSTVFLTKYDTNGNELWTTWPRPRSSTGASAVAVESTGLYVTGHTFGTFSGFESAGKADIYVVKYDFDGSVLWTQQYGGSDYDVPFGIAVTATGVYVAGGTCSRFGNTSGAAGGRGFVTRLDLDGNLVWTRQYDSAPWEAIAADASGIYVTGDGSTRKLSPDGGEVWTRLISGRGIEAYGTGIYVAGGGVDAFVLKLDAGGNVIWDRPFGTSGNDTAYAVAVDGTGVYVAGGTEGAFPDEENAGYADAFVRRFGLDGEAKWTVQFGGPWHDRGLGIDARGRGVYVAGCRDELRLKPREWCEGGGFLAKLVTTKVPPTLTPITPRPAVVIPGQNVTLSATASAPDGAIAAWTWDFGDGSIRHADARPDLRWFNITETQTYAAVGSYTVTLTVEFQEGDRLTEEVTVRVVAPLSLDVSAEPITGTVPLTVSFGASPSGGVPPYSFEWDFGDDSSSTTQYPTHTYQVAGAYIVKLDVRDADGRTTTKTIQITASIAGPRVTGADIPPWGFYALVAAIAVGIGGVILWRRRGRVRTAPPPPGSP